MIHALRRVVESACADRFKRTASPSEIDFLGGGVFLLFSGYTFAPRILRGWNVPAGQNRANVRYCSENVRSLVRRKMVQIEHSRFNV